MGTACSWAGPPRRTDGDGTDKRSHQSHRPRGRERVTDGVARARNASWMSSRRSQRMRSRLMPWYQATVRSTTHLNLPQAGALGLAAAGDPRSDALGLDGLAVLVVVVGPVSEQLAGAPAWPTTTAPYRWDPPDRRQQFGHVVEGAVGQRRAQRDAGALRQDLGPG